MGKGLAGEKFPASCRIAHPFRSTGRSGLVEHGHELLEQAEGLTGIVICHDPVTRRRGKTGKAPGLSDQVGRRGKVPRPLATRIARIALWGVIVAFATAGWNA